jgi:hypothetical protein
MEQSHEAISLSFDDVMFRFCLCQLALEQCKKRFLKLRDHDFSRAVAFHSMSLTLLTKKSSAHSFNKRLRSRIFVLEKHSER